MTAAYLKGMLADVLSQLSATDVVLITAIAILAGFVKGAVGFAMPMIMISGIGSLVSAELALAALILPTLITNLWQALRNGYAAALDSAKAHRTFILILLACILLSAQTVAFVSERVLFLVLGTVLALLAIVQLAGLRLQIRPENRRKAEIGVGAAAGLVGGVAGVWGPPTTMYLTALNTPKVEQMRTQGVVYGAGAMILTVAHVQSGILNPSTAPFSAVLVVPAVLGMIVGFWAQDRMDQARFRKMTLWVLVVASLNLIRRGLTL